MDNIIEHIYNALPDGDKAFVFGSEHVPLDDLDNNKKYFIFGNGSYSVAMLTKGDKTKDKKTAYWLTIITHPVHRRKKLATHLLLDEVKPFIEKCNGQLFSRVMKTNTISQEFHERHGAVKINEDGTHYVYKFVTIV